ncbi:MAG TPA: hypothetical protein ENK05_01460 [Gammaproteobacteria bacterium]|nr:hypothetical protein [Gammaproteobacteria bacterium]
MTETHPKPLVTAVFADKERAQAVVEELVEKDFPMDQVSLLHHAGGSGDDFLGLTYENEKERLSVWGEHGALWGAIGGLLAGATGLIVVPGLGALMVAGPLVEAIIGAATGAGLMAGAAAVTHLTTALHRAGIPEEKLEELHQAVMDGKTLLILHCDRDDRCGNEDPQAWVQKLRWEGAESVTTLP